MRYWLMKTEPSTYGIDDLAAEPDQTDHWDGIRNYQARNMIRDEMKLGDQVLLYHSSCAEPGIVGIAEIVREAYPDHTALDPDSKYYDPKSDADNPRWVMVDVRLVRRLRRNITLRELKSRPDLDGFALLRRGNRLSIMPVSAEHWASILSMETE